MSTETIETIEELRERLAETEEALARAEREQEKIERLNLGLSDEDEGPEFGVFGIDNITMDKDGGVWIGDERYGGPDIIDNTDPNTRSAFQSLQLSPRDLQLAGIRARDDHGRFVPVREEPTEPMIREEPCEGCGSHANLRMINPTMPRWNVETGEAFIEHECQCGETLLTPADRVPGELHQKALDAMETRVEIREHHMERPPRW